MHKSAFIIFFISFFVVSVSAGDIKDVPGQLIRVGVFPNPPVAFKDDKGEWRGISIDVLQAIADQRGWKLEYVEGSFTDHLKNFEARKIDLVSMMAYSKERDKKYTFSRNAIISNWGIVYSRPDSDIASLLDLDGKRVGVMKNNIHDRAFRELARKFDLNIEIVELANFRDVMQAIQSGKVDAGVANRLFGALNASKYNLVETGIIFNPVNIYYASLDPAVKVILDAIDQQLLVFKTDKDSVYFSAVHRWMNQSANTQSYRWLIWVATGLFSVIILMVGLTLLLRRQVAVRTHELQSEVDERREAERKLDELAYYDSLTKLPNRVSLSKRLNIAIGIARRRNTKVAVLFIDIDRFKTVNDSLGHVAGDQLIVHVAKRLQACLREEDSIHRFGGDEFVAILQDITDLSYINHVTERMLRCLSAPASIDSTEVFSSVCIGIALYPDDDDDGDSLLKYSDAAMYHAKDQGGNNYQFYNEELTVRVQKRLSMESRLRHALERDEFRLYYQPIFDLKDQRVIGVEALIRWLDPDRGLVMPDDFIPIAEETGLIVSIGDWVLKHACNQVRKWEEQGLGQLLLAVNVSSLQFEHDRLYSSVILTLKKSGLAAQQLELEITERMFLNITSKVRETLDKLTEVGVRLSIDDFGTGYSSLSYLKQLPIDTLKIDRSFIMGIPEDNDDAQIASTIITMAHGLGMAVTAEGIETKNQLKYLNTLDCGRGQGYYLAKPQSAEETTKWLKTKVNGIRRQTKTAS
ncbi:MAG: hypothetical protein BMS9Abin19_0635 [Gammaproteobacteria bacterium]|nr:MAG: hypothetical protein BMS9Abin19_0635 [Gammaproteobacteria bacterium]